MKRLVDIMGSLVPPEGEAGRPRNGAPERAGRSALDAEACPICKGMGFLVYDVPPGHPDFGKLVPCRCTEARVAAERAAALRAVSNIGQLSRMTFECFQPEGVGLSDPARTNLRAAFDLCREFAREPKGWLVLVGGYGCGKTHLAAAIANFRLALGWPAVFVVVPDLLDHLRATYAPGSAVAFDARLDTVRDAPLLVLDDFGAHNATPWAQEKLFQILNYRYNGRLPTVITMNQRPEELDPRIASRLRDVDFGHVQEILAADYRGSELGGSERALESLSTLGLHSDQSFDTFSSRPDLKADERANLQKVVAVARAYAEKPSGWLVLTGVFGCGKTHLAAAIANYQVSAGRAAPMFVVVPDLLDHLRATFSPTSPTTLDKVFEQVRSASLLILDDLGTESATPWAREKLFQLFNHRYAGRFPTVITTSQNIEHLDERLRTRMLDKTRCMVHAITARSYYGGNLQKPQAEPAPEAPKGTTSRRGRGSRSG